MLWADRCLDHRRYGHSQHSVGISHQYCGQLGEQANCQVAVTLKAMAPCGTKPFTWFSFLVVIGRSGVPPQINSFAISKLFLAPIVQSGASCQSYVAPPWGGLGSDGRHAGSAVFGSIWHPLQHRQQGLRRENRRLQALANDEQPVAGTKWGQVKDAGSNGHWLTMP